jgi:hypothetical protein
MKVRIGAGALETGPSPISSDCSSFFLDMGRLAHLGGECLAARRRVLGG